MVGNGLANIVAALIVAAAILWTGGFGADQAPSALDEEKLAEIYAKAVGDIRNDIVISCGCCGEGPGRADRESF